MFVGSDRICGTCSHNLEMQQKFVTVDPYRCGGCGSKVIEKPCRACEVRRTVSRTSM
jgi:DNA-directed RNA polymerase subunit RPC12/RpoP